MPYIGPNYYDGEVLIDPVTGLPTSGGAGKPVSLVTATSAVTAATYANGNQVGSKLTFSGAPATGTLQGARLRFASAQTAGFDLYLANTALAGSTWADKTTPAGIAAGDIPGIVACVQFVVAASGLGAHTLYWSDGLAKPLASAIVSGVLISKGTPTFATTGDLLGVDLLFLPD